MGEDEAERFEARWKQRFSRGGNGRVLVAESALNVDVVKNNLSDIAHLAEAGATKEDVCNAFGVPIRFFTRDTNMANIQAAERQHSKAIWPNPRRFSEGSTFKAGFLPPAAAGGLTRWTESAPPGKCAAVRDHRPRT